jgi:hypothetical protein
MNSKYRNIETNKEKCDMIYKNLLVSCNKFGKFNKLKDGMGLLYINELQHTARCDHIHDMIFYRAGLKELINKDDKDRYNRVVTFNSNNDDKEIVKKVVHKYHDIIDRELVKALKYDTRLGYNIDYNLEQISEKINSIPSAIKGWFNS